MKRTTFIVMESDGVFVPIDNEFYEFNPVVSVSLPGRWKAESVRKFAAKRGFDTMYAYCLNYSDRYGYDQSSRVQII